ncbi:glutamate-5-semialdehyde dehydrogenase [Aestuariimicrobium sp. p3-SID1156]|uniref:glutamate-5-semialdehyde dehydrogenase n=1 Tax=Aestuariimicrobium sp. p3-SID1156 TaxID=2916038 RepID=UPI00223B308B|nr:glutamate-5-semialdehyde dehydrogenase [Aestuariimicrobium sp. p3-SID1156]MCT1459194.1 glutamate-5-semialdehyde dehydrogenase [Aestuariimicrobium sp. p3-SID1156]
MESAATHVPHTGDQSAGVTPFQAQAQGARRAARELATASRQTKDAALHAMADALLEARREVLGANGRDVATAREQGTSEAMVDRLALTDARLEAMTQGLRDLAMLPDPVGEVLRGWKTGAGVRIEQVRVPLGVVGIIYEARPNVTADAAGICLKSGNATLLRGSSSALESNRVIVAALRAGLEAAGLPADAVNLVEGGREVTTTMMRARGLVDVLIPRGGAGLINHVVENSQVPVIETGTGNCHLYVDASADLEMALEIALNAKTQRPSVCNALETVLVHQDVAGEFWAAAGPALSGAGVTVHADPGTVDLVPGAVAATEEDYLAEALSLDLSARVVGSIDQAIEHIQAHTTGHSETIVSEDARAIEEFVGRVDAAAVLVNASSRFVDGGEFGFGAEIGISTQKLHARGPMGLEEMTSTKYVVTGRGQVRG